MQSKNTELTNDDIANDIAIIGMACRFPGAENPDEFWQNLAAGNESLTQLSDEQLKQAGVPESIYSKPNYVKAGMFLQHMQSFDAGFFGFSPLDAKIMDPQHRHFLECCWEAFENAGYNPEKIDGAVGVYAGSGHNAYMPYNLLSNADLLEDVGFFLIRHTGNDKDFLSTRVSYCLDLKGPSVNVQTACSTSLVAIHQASQSLLNGECDMALAGGVTIELPHNQGYLFKENEILSTDGHCRPFDAASTGTIFGSGAGVVLLKRLEDALADGDYIHAVIKSSAINNDGSDKVSYLAPSVDGQVAAMREALDIADIDPKSIEYIECHGTGTQLGDPIEVAAMTQAYGLENQKKQYCALGAVKSNIGHLDTAAGIAGLIKVVESLKHQQIPATLHYRNANPSIDFASSPFYVNTDLRNWSSTDKRRAAVSSLGVGGTNAHVILEEIAPPSGMGVDSGKLRMIPLSARSEQSLVKYANRFADFLEGQAERPETERASLDNISYTMTVGRKVFNRRSFVLIDDMAQASDALANVTEHMIDASALPSEREVAFMFAGGGAQYSGMGRDLYETEDIYREAVDEALTLIAPFIDYDLKALLYPDPEAIDAASAELERPSRTLPALFITQYAQARLWQSWGVKPAAMIGHSMGENTAACLAGVFSLKDALGLVALRGKLFDTVPQSGMLSVQLGERELKPLIGNLDIAAINAEGLSVVSGSLDELAKFEKKLDQRDASYQRVHINIAAHSRMLDGILEEFADYLRSITLNKPEIPFLSNLSGDWIGDEQATDPEYWVSHLRNTVRFADGANKLLQENNYVLLEVGAGKTLTNLVQASSVYTPQHTVLNSLRHPDEQDNDQHFMLRALGSVWQAGAKVDWDAYFSGTPRQRLPLPTYCFDHQNYWIDPGESAFAGPMATQKFQRSECLDDWLYQPVWKRVIESVAIAPDELDQATVLLLGYRHSFLLPIKEKLQALGATVIVISASDQLTVSDGDYTLDWSKSAHYQTLISEILQQHQLTHIVHALNVDLAEQGESLSASQHQLAQHQSQASFDSLFLLAQALGSEVYEEPLKWLILANGSQQVAGEEVNNPWQSLSLGPVRVLPREFPSFSMSYLDVDSQFVHGDAASLARSLVGNQNQPLLASRNGISYRHCMEAQAIQSGQPSDMELRENGVYLITGGLGGLGLLAAQHLASASNVRLVLLGRHEFPAREHWEALLKQGAPESDTLQMLINIEALGSEVVTLSCDISDLESLRGVKQEVCDRWGAVNGLIHTAGVIDDNLLQLKELTEAHAVLNPKFYGVLALEEVFSAADLDFVVYYSSTSAFMGLAGQVDYASANAYLDSFAHYQHSRGNRHVSTINWPAWKTTGMAAALAKGKSHKLPAGRPVDHPMLDRCILETHEQVEFVSAFSVEQDWVIGEHRLKDAECLMPGTGYIELIRAAFQQVSGQLSVEISNVAFMLPFVVSANEPRPLYLKMERETGREQFRVHIYSDDNGERVEHVSAEVAAAESLAVEATDSQALMARCNRGVQAFGDPGHHPFLDFGDRWACLQSVHLGEHEAAIEIVVDEQYRSELKEFRLHPAVLDMATAGAQSVIEGYDSQSELYVPVGYHSLRFSGELPPTLLSHVRYQSGSHSNSREVIEFDIDLLDANGNCLVQVRGFTMQRVADVNALVKSVQTDKQEIDAGLLKTLELGIADTEGNAVLSATIANGWGPQIAVSVYDLDAVTEELIAPYKVAEVVEDAKDVHDADADPAIQEIEKALLEMEALEQVIVRSFIDEVGDRRLIAYYLLDWNHNATTSEIRRHAKSVLEADLVPKQFVELEELPVDREGNLDKCVLVDPFLPKDTFVAAETGTQKVLAKVWQDVLGIDKVGLTDNFFDIGGHSLLSIRVLTKVEKKFGVRLDQSIIVVNTLEQMAAEIDTLSGTEEDSGASDKIKSLDSSSSDEKVVPIESMPKDEPRMKGEKSEGAFFSSLFKRNK